MKINGAPFNLMGLSVAKREVLERYLCSDLVGEARWPQGKNHHLHCPVDWNQGDSPFWDISLESLVPFFGQILFLE